MRLIIIGFGLAALGKDGKQELESGKRQGGKEHVLLLASCLILKKKNLKELGFIFQKAMPCNVRCYSTLHGRENT